MLAQMRVKPALMPADKRELVKAIEAAKICGGHLAPQPIVQDLGRICCGIWLLARIDHHGRIRNV